MISFDDNGKSFSRKASFLSSLKLLLHQRLSQSVGDLSDAAKLPIVQTVTESTVPQQVLFNVEVKELDRNQYGKKIMCWYKFKVSRRCCDVGNYQNCIFIYMNYSFSIEKL